MKSTQRLLMILVLMATALAAPIGTRAEDAPKQPVLDAKLYKQRCLLCHSIAVPEGVAPRVVADLGLKAETPARNPSVQCWRRCTKCWSN